MLGRRFDALGRRRNLGAAVDRLHRVLGLIYGDVLVDVEVVVSRAGPGVVLTHAIEHELAELCRVGVP